MSPKSLNGAGPPAADHASHLKGRSPTTDAVAPDSHGRAALLLVESLIHELIEKAVLTRAEAIGVIDIAVDVEEELAFAAGMASSQRSRSPLAPLAATLR